MKSLRSDTCKQSRYFLQIKLLSLSIVNPYPPSLLTIKLYKGMQKLDQITQSIKSSTYPIQFQRSLTFYTTLQDSTVSPKTTSSYRIVVEELQNGKKIGEISLDVAPVISGFIRKGESEVDKLLQMGDDIQLETRIFVQKTKEELNRSVCSFEQTRSMGRYKTRTEIGSKKREWKGHNSVKSNNQSFVKQSSEKKKSNTRESNHHPSSKALLQLEGQSDLFTQPDSPEPLSPTTNILPNNNEDWNDQEFDSISVIQSKKIEKNKNTQGGLSTGIVVTIIVLFLCMLGLFIVKLQDQKGELARIVKVTRRVLASTQSPL